MMSFGYNVLRFRLSQKSFFRHERNSLSFKQTLLDGGFSRKTRNPHNVIAKGHHGIFYFFLLHTKKSLREDYIESRLLR